MKRSTTIQAQPLSNYKKQVDYKILYGSLFQNMLKSEEEKYSHWGWTDPDILFGNIDYFMEDWSFDIYTSYFMAGYHEGTLAGQLTIFRNNHRFRNLWKEIGSEAYGKMNSAREYGMDERVLGKYVFEKLFILLTLYMRFYYAITESKNSQVKKQS
jgi:hypothetical protein